MKFYIYLSIFFLWTMYHTYPDLSKHPDGVIGPPSPEIMVGRTVEAVENIDFNQELINSLVEDMLKYKTKLTKEDAVRFSTEIVKVWSEKYPHIDLKLVVSLMYVESHFDEDAISHAGAKGLMQVMPFWRSKCELQPGDLKKAEKNIPCGLYILDHYMKLASTEDQALCRYNGACQKCGSCSYSRKVRKAYKVIDKEN